MKKYNYSTDLANQIKLVKLPKPILEYKFHPKRRWRFDLCWGITRDHGSVALEIEGGVWSYGRHTRGSGFIKDMEKYNEAALLGWRIFRVTPQQVKSGEALKLVERILKNGD